jgi:hypothetical protein
MVAGLLSQSYDARKPSVFVDFPVLDFVSFNGKPQALQLNFAYACGSPLNENDQDTIKSTGCWMCLERRRVVAGLDVRQSRFATRPTGSHAHNKASSRRSETAT